MRKIALVGAPCVGKTTLFEALEAEFKNRNDVAFVDEAAREYFQTHTVAEDIKFKLITQGAIQQLVIKKETEAAVANPDIMICDRSVLDAAMYLIALGDMSDGLKLLDTAKAWLPSYHRIFLLSPKGVAYINDHIRKGEQQLREKVHKTFVKYMDDYNIEYELLKGSNETRLRAICSML